MNKKKFEEDYKLFKNICLKSGATEIDWINLKMTFYCGGYSAMRSTLELLESEDGDSVVKMYREIETYLKKKEREFMQSKE